ncbi:MAG: N(G),N(G)-dimethylarginine dimethylaminohydrolase [Candidatus Marinimicrobia bacterium]|nr:N(G),N(G)-dimethylarginine dimethylaminohydrolase [Candidatus Neomarinimicrobiota bacterium]MCF7850281.1 N(G),N(G)-dimethylarginine dimethylaminohydrolase [Candidatus Neomarinimicrobiota bacterium]MCF7903822.1 N(G),N(G)-dimethylarginine dimethylaminohydrolase [Candidatus Neomarinimicrobiota bacterium]
MFKHAIVRTPCKNMVAGLTGAGLGKPDHSLAMIQHQAYIKVLESCNVEVTILPPDEKYPDSTFVEDVALLTPHCAIITRPGAPSRQGETEGIQRAITPFYSAVEVIREPGTIDAGDIMMVGEHYYIGLSERTNPEGARQMIQILEQYGMSGSTVDLKHVLHLKTGAAYLENNNLVVCGEFTEKAEFEKFNRIVITEANAYSANCIWVNDRVVIPSGFPRTKELISSAGYPVIETDMSEFQKLDGGLSCLSLRF